MADQEKILNFISRFHGSEHVFLHGCCYWFAHILEMEYLYTGDVTIMYEPVEGHFITKIGNRYYDVRGDVTELYQGKTIYDMDALPYVDDGLYRRLMRDCRDFDEEDE